VGFVERLRAEERFSSKEALVAQIHKDIERTRALWRARGA
jgi:FAD synthase